MLAWPRVKRYSMCTVTNKAKHTMHIDYDTFIATHAANTQLNATACEECIVEFNSKVIDKHEGFVATDLGAVMVYMMGSTFIAWLDYELAVGYIA